MGNESSKPFVHPTICPQYHGKLLSIDYLDTRKYDIENLAFGSGGAKAVAYAGAAEVLKQAGILQNVKRFTGVGTGAVVAALLALGFETDSIRATYNRLMDKLLIDDRIGYAEVSTRFPEQYGWNSGENFITWLGELLQSKSYDSELTFYQLYETKRVELCILVTNLAKMCTMYCHPKTTPDMPIRQAILMAMSLPGIFIPREYTLENELCVDGSLTCTYPIHVFDGWWLSMDKQNSFLTRIDPSKREGYASRYEPKNPKTLGFFLLDKHDECMHKELVDRLTNADAKLPIPWTVLGRKHEEAFQIQLTNEVKYSMYRKACDKLFTLAEQVANDTWLSFEENLANRIFKEDLLCPEDRCVLLPHSIETEEACAAYLREICNKESGPNIDSIKSYCAKQALSLLEAYSNYYKTKNNSLHDFFGNISNVLQNNSYKLSREDYPRTVGIFCGYIGGNDINMEMPDQIFLYKQGWNATALFLREYFGTGNGSVVDSK